MNVETTMTSLSRWPTKTAGQATDRPRTYEALFRDARIRNAYARMITHVPPQKVHYLDTWLRGFGKTLLMETGKWKQANDHPTSEKPKTDLDDSQRQGTGQVQKSS